MNEISNLIDRVKNKKEEIVYINLNEKDEYQGWVKDFGIEFSNGLKMSLDLKNEEDLFLLFILASSWSKTGPWENAAYFVSYLKFESKTELDYWLKTENVEKEIQNKENSALKIISICSGVVPRKKVSFRKDYFNSIQIIAREWDSIKSKLNEAEQKNDFMIFIDYISSIEGLGAGKNKMRIKIPLILRELRCQNIYKNIPGIYCCVPDERVKKNAEQIGIKLPRINSIGSILKASSIIYSYFGNLYDIPLFAYDDVK